jgi:hypothetical protein
VDGDRTSSDEREAYRDYADKVTLSVRLAEMPIDELVSEVLEVESFGAAWSRKWLVDEAESIPASINPGDGPAPHTVDVIERRHEWGASSATFEILMYLSNGVVGGIVGNAAYDAVKAVVKKMVDQRRLSGDDGLIEPITEAEAKERSAALVGARFQEPIESLEIRAIEVKPPFGAVVVYRGVNGWDYTCELTGEDGLVYFSRIRRSRTDKG